LPGLQPTRALAAFEARTWLRYVAGIVISAAGTVTTLRAHLGLSPWDVLHDGLSRRTPLTFGQAVMTVSIIVVVGSWLVGIKPGIATILNTFLMGWFDDLFLATRIGADLVDAPIELRLAALVAGIVLIGLGAAVYIGAGHGAGPRDSLQLALSLRLRVPPGWSRAAIEGVALLAGWALGGSTGIGTLVFVATIGAAVGIAFAILKVDPAGRRFPIATATES
jgi:uncharacterized membrane protein YczE